ncbi:MAG TPA: cache domain-containing protein [Thermodesulfovibrionales bacterium]|nr:cache domain-containing protein [Thermodesulfovibrionales bacterium]
MKKLCAVVVCAGFLFVLTLPSFGGGTPEEAKALVEKAIAFYKANGKEKALAEFSKPKGQFTKGDLYIFAYNPKGIIIAHGGDPKLVGKDFANVQDADGKYFAREFITIGPEGGWVDYKWMDYATKKVEAKTSYLKRIDDVIIGCGVYK